MTSAIVRALRATLHAGSAIADRCECESKHDRHGLDLLLVSVVIPALVLLITGLHGAVKGRRTRTPLWDEHRIFLADILPTAFEVGVVNGNVKPGNRVAVVGAGPIGLAANICSWRSSGSAP